MVIPQGKTISLFNSETRWRMCKLYKKFLFNCSPLDWRRKHDTLSTETEENTDAAPSFLVDTESEETGLTVDEILEVAEKECKDHEPPKLYFTDPKDLLDLLEYMETQNVNNLMHTEELAEPLALIHEHTEIVVKKFDTMIERLYSSVERLETEIEWEVSRVEELENITEKLIFVDFKEIVSSTEVLNLFCYVEDIYESIIGPNDTNFNAKKMINVIEEHYRGELFFLDMMPPEEVAYLEGTAIKEHKKVLKFAEKASKQIAEMEILNKALKNTYTPPYEKPIYKPVMFRSPIMRERKPPPPPPKKMSQTEIDYLEHFTEFCEYTDVAEDFLVNKTLLSQVKKQEGKTQHMAISMK